MTQQFGESIDAMIENDNKKLEKILSANKNRTKPYYIVFFAKAMKNTLEGKPILTKFFKPYSKRPKSCVGLIIGEVDNSKSEIKWEVNLPQKPIDYNKLLIIGAKPCNEVVVETTTIPHAYLTN